MPTLRLSGTSFSEIGFAGFTLNLDEPAAAPIVVGYRTISGTAVVGEDFRNANSSVTIDPGELSQDFRVQVFADRVVEPDEAYVVEAFIISGNATFPGGSLIERETAFILDDDGSSQPNALYVSRPEVTEGDQGRRMATFELDFSRPLSEDISIGWSTVDGSAVGGEDFVPRSGTLNLLAGQNRATIAVPILVTTSSRRTSSSA